MKKYIIKELGKVTYTYLYEVEANSPKEAKHEYVNQLAGLIDPFASYSASDFECEGITVIEKEDG